MPARPEGYICEISGTKECAEKDLPLEAHTCPYDADVNNNPFSICHCCSCLTQECAMDV
jgi:hypothetical protein